MMDHFFDKLLQVSRPSPTIVRNAYLEKEASERAAPLLRICTMYGATGEVPVGEIEEMVERLGLRGGKKKQARDTEEEEQITAKGVKCQKRRSDA